MSSNVRNHMLLYRKSRAGFRSSCHRLFFVALRTVVDVIAWLLYLQKPIHAVPITSNAASSNPAYSEVYSIQHYVIQFVSDLQQAGGFLRVLWFPPPIKLTATK